MRLIDADNARIDADERGCDFWTSDTDIDNVQKFLDQQPTVVDPVIHGRWIYDGYYDMFACSICGGEMVRKCFAFCPWCGAKMDEEA